LRLRSSLGRARHFRKRRRRFSPTDLDARIAIMRAINESHTVDSKPDMRAILSCIGRQKISLPCFVCMREIHDWDENKQ
jgi:hypothetical protein